MENTYPFIDEPRVVRSTVSLAPKWMQGEAAWDVFSRVNLSAG